MKRNALQVAKFWTLHSLALWLVSSTASALIYKSVDENGVVTFSDVLPAASLRKKTAVIKPNTTNSMPGLRPTVNNPEAATVDEPAAHTVSIASPLSNATIPMGAGIFDVTAELGAPLAGEEVLALYLDDEMVDGPQRSKVWTLTYVIRSPHTLQVRRLARVRETISQSERVTVFVLRPSVLRATPR